MPPPAFAPSPHTPAHTHVFLPRNSLLPRSLSASQRCLPSVSPTLPLRYTLLKGLELSKAAAQGLNKVLGDKHEKSRDAKDVYRDFLSKKQVLLL